jgi:RNA polymerase sigma-70 factor (ECF subfamily)
MTDAELTQLYEQYGYLVHRRCAALLGNASDAEDALQETFLRVKRYGARPTTGSALSWLYTIASDSRASGSGADADRRALVGAALRTLDERTRQIGVLHYLDGYTQEEVAAQTGYSRRTVGKKLKIFEDLFRSSGFSAAPEEMR